MFRLLNCALALLFIASVAQADWMRRGSEAIDDIGGAYVENAQGQRLDVRCGKAGSVEISLTPGLRPAGLRFGDRSAILVFRVDGGAPMQMPATCNAEGCFQDFLLEGVPWPIHEMRQIIRAFRSGTRVDVLLNGEIASSFDLAGSSAALDWLAARTRCAGL